jgi:hypothetical protein
MDEFFRHGYALLIGVTDSTWGDLALPIVGKDVAALEQVLIDSQRCAYLPGNVTTLKGKEASRAGILRGLAWLEEQIGRDSSGNATAVVYYSGHGWRDESADPHEFFLLPYDVQERRLRSYALRAQDFAEAVDAVQPRRLLVLLDCCHAGGMEVKGKSMAPSGFAETALAPKLLMGEGGRFPSGGKGLDTLEEGAGRAVLSSSTGEQRSYFRTDRKMSIFTYYLIEALTGHAQPQQGATEVLVSDVMGHVSRHVPQAALEGYGAPQQPDHQVRGNDFPVALLLGGKGLSAGQPAPDPLSLLQETRGGGTEITGNVSRTDIVGDVSHSTIITGTGNVSVQNVSGSRRSAEGDPGVPSAKSEELEREGEEGDGQ